MFLQVNLTDLNQAQFTKSRLGLVRLSGLEDKKLQLGSGSNTLNNRFSTFHRDDLCIHSGHIPISLKVRFLENVFWAYLPKFAQS